MAGNITRTELEKRIKDITLEKNKVIEDLKNYIGELHTKLNKYEMGEVVVGTETDTKRQILKFHAQGLNVIEIRDKLIALGIEYSEERITRVVNNIDMLDNTLQLYYKEEVEAFEKSVKINPNILKEANIRDIQFLINEIRKMIDTTQNEEEKLKYMDRYNTFINTRTKLMADVIIEKEEQKQGFNVLEESMKNYAKNIENITKQKIEFTDLMTLSNIN